MSIGEDEMRIMSVGPSGVGKSTIGNKLLGLKSKDIDYFKTGASSHSCTQEPRTVRSGKLTYTDLPGIPDTNPRNTKAFYDLIIDEAKKPLTAVFFVFAVDMRMDKHSIDRLKQCGLLFREINKCSAAKLLILNDFNAWSNPEGLEEDDEEYFDEKAKHDKARNEAHIDFEQAIKKIVRINFNFTVVCYGLNKKINQEHNMDTRLSFFKSMLKTFPCEPSPSLLNFENLEKIVLEAKDKQDYEKIFIQEQENHIKSLEKSIKNLKVTRVRAIATGLPLMVGGLVLVPFTLGISGYGVVAAAFSAAATTFICIREIKSKELELETARETIDKEKLEEAVQEYKSKCEYFEELKNALKE
uniref:AIG1-type G domain-containing protein n=1 Tax=Clytia hemisphaerica TaxID=252671 RepID=A0A7M5WVJ6_9CNID